jgi:hypothetical protein
VATKRLGGWGLRFVPGELGRASRAALLPPRAQYQTAAKMILAKYVNAKL